MSRKYEQINRTVTKLETIVTECTCDLCGRTDGPWDDFDTDKPQYHGDKVEVVIRMKEGHIGYGPEGGGHYQEKEYDVCTDCFKSKIMPVFPVPPRIENVDW